MYLVGLTGGIGSGKSTVAELLAELGCEVIDADAVAREVVEPAGPALAGLADRFGPDILDEDGRLDRAALARVAFADEASRADLDRLTHPHIAARIAERVARLAGGEDPHDPRIVVVDHPLLLETGQASRFDAVVVVLADEQRRIDRLRARGMDDADVRRRIAAQTDDATRRGAATHVIDNDGELEDLTLQVRDVHARLLAAARTGRPG